MKLAMVTDGQFHEIFNKVNPANREEITAPFPNFYLRSLDIFVINREVVTLVDCRDLGDPISIARLVFRCNSLEGV